VIAETRFLGALLEVRNRVSPQISVGKQKSLQKPGFSERCWRSETGFLHKSRLGSKGDRRNRVSRSAAGGQKPGFSTNLCWEAKVIAETRFLVRNRVSQQISWLGNKGYCRNPVSWSLGHTTRQIIIVPSSPPLTRVCPSGLMARD